MAAIDAADVEGWLTDLELEPIATSQREEAHSWDLRLDGRRRPDIRVTLILDPGSAMVCWVHFAPPLNDSFRVSYRQFLRWNDEFPFVKFALAADDRPVLTAEIPIERLDGDALGSTLCRLLAVCDLTYERSAAWLHPGARTAPPMERPSRQARLFERFADQLPELAGQADETPGEDDDVA